MQTTITPLREPDLERSPQPPANVEAEQALLGAILINNAAHGRVAEFLLPDRVLPWLTRSTNPSPVRIHLIMRGLLTNSTPLPDPAADPGIGAIELLASR